MKSTSPGRGGPVQSGDAGMGALGAFAFVEQDTFEWLPFGQEAPGRNDRVGIAGFGSKNQFP